MTTGLNFNESLEENSPYSSSVDGELDLQVEVSSDGVDEVNFSYSDAGEDEFEEIGIIENDDDNNVVYQGWELGSPGDGEYEIRAIGLDGDGIVDDANDTIEVEVDNSSPDLADNSPEGWLDDAFPEVEGDFEDDNSGLEYISIEIDENSDWNTTVSDLGGESSETATFDFDDEDEELDDGSYTVEWEALDVAGNSDSGSWSFSVDTVDPDPDDYELDPSEGLHETELGEDFDIEITVDPSQDHESEIEAFCFVDGTEEDSDGTEEFEEGEEVEFECSIPSDYMDESVEFDFELEDEVGNDWSSDYYVYDLDATPPRIEYFESLINISVFNDDFEVEYMADDLSGVQSVEYYLNNDPGEGEGTSFSDDEGDFQVDSSDLDTGNNTVYLRAQDEFDRWGSTSSIDFEFIPDQSPELDIYVDNDLELEAGETYSLDVEIENVGDVFIPSGELEISGIFSASADYVDLLPEDNFETSLEFEASENDIGEHELDLSFSTSEDSETIDVIVNPDEEGREDIEDQLTAYFEEYDALAGDFEELQNNGLSEERVDRVETDLSSFEASLNDIESLAEDDDYFEAHSLVDDLGGEMQQAQDTLDEVEEEHQVSVRNRRVVMVVAGLFLVLTSSVLYVFYSEEYELDVPRPEEFMPDPESGSPESEDSEGLIDKLRESFEEFRASDEDQGPEYEFK